MKSITSMAPSLLKYWWTLGAQCLNIRRHFGQALSTQLSSVGKKSFVAPQLPLVIWGQVEYASPRSMYLWENTHTQLPSLSNRKHWRDCFRDYLYHLNTSVKNIFIKVSDIEIVKLRRRKNYPATLLLDLFQKETKTLTWKDMSTL